MPTTQADVDQAESVLNNDYSAWTTKNTNVINAQAALATATAAAVPAKSAVLADAAALFTKVLTYIAPMITAVGGDPYAILSPIFTATVPAPPPAP